MSKNITIKEGATPRNFTAKKLKTNVTGGGTCLWVPEEDVQLATKSITENGTYKASDEGEYGYSQVTVNVPGGAGGSPGGAGSSIIGTDMDGNDYLIEVEQDGTLDKTKLPSSITVTTPPTKTTYTDGEAIDITGMVIVCYDAEGHPLSFVDLSEATINPTTADISQTVANSKSLDGMTVAYIPINGFKTGYYITGYDYREFSGSGYVVNYTNPVEATAIMSLDSSCSFRPHKTDGTYDTAQTYALGATYVTDDGQTVHYTPAGGNPYDQIPPLSEYDLSTIMEVLFNSHSTDTGGAQTITVSWSRPGDGKILTTTFDIEVEEATQSGGSQGTL